MAKREDFRESEIKFTETDGHAFGASLRELYDHFSGVYLEWRIRKSDKKMCIIQYYEKDLGYSTEYSIYVIE